jgi:protein gp37
VSKIEWTDETLNCVTGCTPVSSGCKNCYARRMHKRLQNMGLEKYAADFDEVNIWPDVWEKVGRWKRPRRVFVNSMSDTFHEEVDDWFIIWMFKKMEEYSQHTFQVLTKRPIRAFELRMGELRFPPNVWMGVTVEDILSWGRVKTLLNLDAAVRFVSFEPLLGRIPFRLMGKLAHGPDGGENPTICLEGIDWAIIGCETGPGARPMHDDWVRGIIAECRRHNVKIFYKQQMVGGKKVSMPAIDDVVRGQMPKRGE